MIDGLGQIVTGRRGTEDVGGPIKIAQIAGQQASLGALPFVQLLALFSINLGFINLLPVPMLDGGHLFFYTVEAVRRRPLSARALDWAFRGGLAVILALVAFTTINDLGFDWPLGPASALDWLGGLGQGRNRGLAAKRAACTICMTRRGSVISGSKSFSRRASALFMVGTMLGGSATPLLAQGCCSANRAAQPGSSVAGHGSAVSGICRSRACARSADDPFDRGSR